jgi:hypothetical protein
MRTANAKSAAIPFKNQQAARLSFIGTWEISERVSENIHFDFLADKNYTSEGGGTQMKGQVSRRNCSARVALVRHSERNEESFFSNNPRGIPHSADLE